MATLYGDPTGVGDPLYQEWSNDINVLASDDSYATANQVNLRMDTDGYDLSAIFIPAGAFVVIDAMLCRVEAKTSSIGLGRVTLGVQLSWDGGTSWSDQYTAKWTLAEGEVIKYFVPPGIVSDRTSWGRVWTYDEISTSNLRARLAVAKIDANTIVSVDHIQVGIEYHYESNLGSFGHVTGDPQLISAF